MKYDCVCLRHTNQLCSQDKSLRLRFISVLVPTLRHKGNIQEKQWLNINLAKQMSKRMHIAQQFLDLKDVHVRRWILDT